MTMTLRMAEMATSQKANKWHTRTSWLKDLRLADKSMKKKWRASTSKTWKVK